MKQFLLVLVIGISFLYGIAVEKVENFPYAQFKFAKLFFASEKKGTTAFDNPIDDSYKPNVLIIGDSISIGYTPYVREVLIDKADVFRIPENGRYSRYGTRKLEEWLKIADSWELIHFNFGLWDMQYMQPFDTKNGIQRSLVDEYKEQLESLVVELKKTGAKLVWANTTPVPRGAGAWVEGDEMRFNAAALDVMTELGVKVNDLHSHAMINLRDIQIPGDVHFNEAGYSYLSIKVVQEVSEALAGS